MNKRVLTIILLISMAINAGIIGGLLVTGLYRNIHNTHHYRYPEGPNRRLDDRWDSRRMEDANTRALREAFRATKIELMQELAKDPVDDAKVQAIIERSIAIQSDLERALGAQLLETRKNMSSEEAKNSFSERIDFMERRQDRTDDRRLGR